MQFSLEIPEDENENYAESLTVDLGGVDLHLDGETYSAAFTGIDRYAFALAVLDEEEVVDKYTLENFMVRMARTQDEPLEVVVSRDFYESIAFMALKTLERLKESE